MLCECQLKKYLAKWFDLLYLRRVAIELRLLRLLNFNRHTTLKRRLYNVVLTWRHVSSRRGVESSSFIFSIPRFDKFTIKEVPYKDWSQDPRPYDVRKTLLQRCFNFLASFQRPYNVVSTSHTGWVSLTVGICWSTSTLVLLLKTFNTWEILARKYFREWEGQNKQILQNLI